MTYRKLAELAGVSVSTVSKAMSDGREVSGETIERIRRLAEEYGVTRPKYRRDTKPRIAILVPEIVSTYYSEITTELADRLRAKGIEPSIYICGFEAERSNRLVRMLNDEKLADGIFSMSTDLSPSENNIPIFCLMGSAAPTNCGTTGYNTAEGIFMALEYLKSLGHTKIGFLGENNTEKKLRFFRSGLAQLGLAADERFVFVSAGRFEQAGYEGAEHILKLAERPTALCAAYDEIALGAVKVFREHGVRIPEELSIVGINDIPTSSYAGIPLTTIRPNIKDMIDIGIAQMTAKLEGKSGTASRGGSSRSELVIRQTTAKPGRTDANETADAPTAKKSAADARKNAD